ncbi:MAG: RdgB/HAM1 family non-canonical purine NTP pyrophosphatase [Candidatus Buchananbacteria bacterium]|nr:RdgB/HAM1 family non-canonical purine NTP pyrophosphatase [Candidatus Buchananbacteria bacterium]
MKKLLIATKNQGKIKEIKKELTDFAMDIVGLENVNLPEDSAVQEPAITMEGNAIIKAMTYGNKTGLLTLAEDAGLEVDALNGRPGVLSARYASGTDKDRYLKLLREMQAVSDKKRGAQFRSVIAIYDPESEKIRTCEGIYRGKIIQTPKGKQGFGYDPIFLNENLGKTNAQMTAEEKNSVSHRGKALKNAKEILKKEFKQ